MRVFLNPYFGFVFALIRKCDGGLDVQFLLKGPIAHSGFKRLN